MSVPGAPAPKDLDASVENPDIKELVRHRVQHDDNQTQHHAAVSTRQRPRLGVAWAETASRRTAKVTHGRTTGTASPA